MSGSSGRLRPAGGATELRVRLLESQRVAIVAGATHAGLSVSAYIVALARTLPEVADRLAMLEQRMDRLEDEPRQEKLLR